MSNATTSTAHIPAEVIARLHAMPGWTRAALAYGSRRDLPGVESSAGAQESPLLAAGYEQIMRRAEGMEGRRAAQDRLRRQQTPPVRRLSPEVAEMYAYVRVRRQAAAQRLVADLRRAGVSDDEHRLAVLRGERVWLLVSQAGGRSQRTQALVLKRRPNGQLVVLKDGGKVAVVNRRPGRDRVPSPRALPAM